MILEISRYGNVLATIQTQDAKHDSAWLKGSGVIMTHLLSQLLGDSQCHFELEAASLRMVTLSSYIFIPGPLKVTQIGGTRSLCVEV